MEFNSFTTKPPRLGKNIVKEAIEMSAHSLKLHFCMFEKSHVKHNSLDCHNFFWNIFHWHIWLKKKTFEKNKDCPFSRFECFKHAKTFLICVKL
jgi:hypothetical protein